MNANYYQKSYYREEEEEEEEERGLVNSSSLFCQATAPVKAAVRTYPHTHTKERVVVEGVADFLPLPTLVMSGLSKKKKPALRFLADSWPLDQEERGKENIVGVGSTFVSCKNGKKRKRRKILAPEAK